MSETAMKIESIFFTSEEHRHRFVEMIQQLSKAYHGKYDPEYASALYILTADLWTWQAISDYVSRDGIDIEAILENIHLSSGYTTLIKLAGNLFNGNQDINPVEFLRLDESNFLLAINALLVRRHGFAVEQSRQVAQRITQ